MIPDDFLTAPAVVVGGGIAGLSAALGLRGAILVANERIGGGSSRLAQGGVAAAIGPDDSPALHAADTLAVAAGIADPGIAALAAEAATDRVGWLESLGVAFDRTRTGAYELGLEGGHGRRRVMHAGGDRTGAAIMQALRAAALARPDMRVLEGFELIDLVTSGDRIAGVLVESPSGAVLALLAPHVVLATGGIGACFEYTTNPGTSRGVGLAAAARQGVALADLEFVQFHPTALAVQSDPLPLLTEALRGAGARLVDDRGRRFMTAAHPHAELAPRDVIARSVHALRMEGRQAFLDATRVDRLAERFPGACALARTAGLQPTTEPLPVTVAAHFHMGGIATDAWGATSIKGLRACGEVAATGLHGGNRLASNSLLEALVFGARVAQGILAMPLAAAQSALEIPHRPMGSRSGSMALNSLRQLVGACLGPLRSEDRMLAAMKRLDHWHEIARADEDLLFVTRLLLTAALRRRESRGAHQRADYPQAAPVAARSYLVPVPVPRERLRLLHSSVA